MVNLESLLEPTLSALENELSFYERVTNYPDLYRLSKWLGKKELIIIGAVPSTTSFLLNLGVDAAIRQGGLILRCLPHRPIVNGWYPFFCIHQK